MRLPGLNKEKRSLHSILILPENFDQKKIDIYKESITKIHDLGFTYRQSEVIGYLLEGEGNQYIANKLFIEEKTVKFHLTNIYKFLGVKSRFQAAMKIQKMLAEKEKWVSKIDTHLSK